MDYLAFAPAHQELAGSIAREAAERAAVVVGRSGRVGRTRLLSPPERATLAVRAQIRHTHTDYEQQLDDEAVGGIDDELYRAIKTDTHHAVDAFPKLTAPHWPELCHGSGSPWICR